MKLKFSFMVQFVLIIFLGNNMNADLFKDSNIKNAYFAGGCFWGVEHYFEKKVGVKDAVSGYMGGRLPNPDYKSVSTGLTGHLEVVQVVYDSTQTDFETLARLFFEIHDPTQTNGQGPDIGSQYLSAVFYNDEHEKQILQNLITKLEQNGYRVATKLISSQNHIFYKAESYHQDYYSKTGKVPYCHTYTKRFKD